MVHYILFFIIFNTDNKIVKQVEFYEESNTYNNCEKYVNKSLELFRDNNPQINIKAICKQKIII